MLDVQWVQYSYPYIHAGAQTKGEAMILFDKQYDGESIVDMDRDVNEFFSDSLIDDFSIPQDENGIMGGSFRVIVEWTPE